MVFEDPSRQRWKLVRAVFAVICALGAMLLLDLGASCITSPPLPALPELSIDPGQAVRNIVEQEATSGPMSQPVSAGALPRPSGDRFARFTQPGLLRTAFVVQEDPHSVTNLKNTIAHLDAVLPDWFTLSSADGALGESVHSEVADLLRTSGVLVLPRLSNTDDAGRWRAAEFSHLLRDAEASTRSTQTIVARLQANHADGINVDIESLERRDREPYLDWLESLVSACRQVGLLVTVDVPMNEEAFDYEAIGEIADAVVVMAYDESYAGGRPGPIASRHWFDEGVEDMAQRIPPGKLIVGLGAYGYDWNTASRQEAQPIDFEDAMLLAEEFGVEVETDKASLNSTFRYTDARGAVHVVWFLDAVSAWNQFLTIRHLGVRGFSLWRLGLEEPSVWEFLGTPSPDAFDPASLEAVKPLQTVALEGEGELLKVREVPRNGRRQLTFDGRLIDYATYETLPRYFTVEKFGHPVARQLALTFDDGPDPVWTPRILQILKQYGVKATFFVVGDQAQRAPQLVRQEWRDGHLLGNHTFLHPNIQKVSEARLRMELNATQRVIESITRRQTLLFRAPYDTDSTPTQPQELRPLHTACQLGYVVAAGDIDSEDYATPGTDQIIRNVMKRLETPGAHVIVMHDAGGNRQQTVEALTRLIPQLQQAGYEFVTLDRLLGVPRERLMPRAPAGERLVTTANRVAEWWLTWGWFGLVVLFFATTALAVLRILFLGTFVLRGPWRPRVTDSGFTPPVVVLVPAYNEEKVIARTVDALLASDYPNFSVLVVNDGSTDGTADIVQAYARRDLRVGMRSKPNGGKHSALNLGFNEADAEYVVTIDADTIVTPETIRRLVAPFADPDVDAVCGNVQVGNVRNLLTAFQEVEYTTSQNYDRRAFEALNCISVVPGATGAWKRQTVLQVGGYSPHTLTEDADLTLTVLAAGGRIVYAPLAKSITEAPESTRTLFKQRFRWSFGTFQSLWKHRQHFGKGGLGRIALPNMLLFQVVFPILSPIGDLVLLLSLLRGDCRPVVVGYILFLLMDLSGSLIAFALDRKPLTSLWVVLIQRFYYRQFMYVVAFKALVAAIRGRRHGWNKLDRKASVSGWSRVRRAGPLVRAASGS